MNLRTRGFEHLRGLFSANSCSAVEDHYEVTERITYRKKTIDLIEKNDRAEYKHQRTAIGMAPGYSTQNVKNSFEHNLRDLLFLTTIV